MLLATIEHGTRLLAAEFADGVFYVLNGTASEIVAGNVPQRTGETLARDAVKVRAPLRPGKIIAIGRNYAEHAAELGNNLPPAPLIFAKFPSCIVGDGDVIHWESSVTQAVDWEGELAVVIGTTCKHVPEADAYSVVYGYTIANDVSARDIQLEQDSQWTRGKSLDTFCPLGPWIVTHDVIGDPHQLRVQTLVNGETVQDAPTSQMIFKIPHLIAYCSRMFTLEAGDLILTGTPSGVGRSYKPPRYLGNGDQVTVRISDIGELTNGCKVD
jgi:2-keto-4-pentenoate hydratase/2-oxohepta-3-ene-1,7-dioic acid hydratase in catechol pathway